MKGDASSGRGLPVSQPSLPDGREGSTPSDRTKRERIQRPLQHDDTKKLLRLLHAVKLELRLRAAAKHNNLAGWLGQLEKWGV